MQGHARADMAVHSAVEARDGALGRRPVRLSGTENRHNAIQKSHAEVGFIGGLGQPSTYGVPAI